MALIAGNHTKIKGTAAELFVAAKLMLEGWNVLFPADEASRYDLVVEKGGKFVRIQVKYVTPKNGVLKVNCKSSNNWSVKHYTADEIDVVAAYNSVSRIIYYISATELRRNELTLRLESVKNGQAKGIRIASNYQHFPVG